MASEPETPITDHVTEVILRADQSLEKGDTTPKPAYAIAKDVALGLALLESRVEGIAAALTAQGIDLGLDLREHVQGVRVAFEESGTIDL